jgi:cytochrome c biogenesis protein CcdA
MVAAVNPCGFALLPAYLGLYLGMFEDTATPSGRTKSILTALQVSIMVTAGFVLLFGTVGLAVGLLTSTISKLLPWTGLAIGILLVFVGGRTVTGGMLYAGATERFADRLGNAAGKTNLTGYFAYGLAYAAASLGCTLPIFLAVVGSTMARGGLVPATFQFLLYALGMGTVITALTLGTALFKQAAVARVRTVLPFVQPASAILLLGAGAYLIYYWLTIGGLLPR